MKTINLRPYLTEKSTQQEGKGFYTFRVPFTATKIDVKNAIEQRFGKEFAVDTVRMARVRSKVRVIGRGRSLTKRPRFKKAIISLKDKEKILDVTSPKA